MQRVIGGRSPKDLLGRHEQQVVMLLFVRCSKGMEGGAPVTLGTLNLNFDLVFINHNKSTIQAAVSSDTLDIASLQRVTRDLAAIDISRHTYVQLRGEPCYRPRISSPL